MTTEMGPRDVDLTLSERFASRITRYVVPLVSEMSDTVSIRFDPRRATLSLSGESDHAGDAFNRGLLVGLVYLLNMLLTLAVLSLAAEAAQAATEISTILALAVGIPFLFVSGAGVAFAMGTAGLLFKTDVVDHTTEPAPDALDDLQQQYVDGEIDEAELGKRTAEVWER